MARQEAVQPSLWDRLINDLPGIEAEVINLRRELAKALGEDEASVDVLVAGGTRAVERHETMTDDQKILMHRLVGLSVRQRRLQEGGVVVTPNVLREAVRRDIEMLFNIERMEAQFLLTQRETLDHESPDAVLADFPEVRASVINYGVPSFSGRSGASFDQDILQRQIKEVLNTFEPRLKKETVRVRVFTGEKVGMRIDIDGVLLLSPVPERLRLSTTIDLDSGRAATSVEAR